MHGILLKLWLIIEQYFLNEILWLRKSIKTWEIETGNKIHFNKMYKILVITKNAINYNYSLADYYRNTTGMIFEIL